MIMRKGRPFLFDSEETITTPIVFFRDHPSTSSDDSAIDAPIDRLHWKKIFVQGLYVLTLQFGETEDRGDFVVRVEHREIGCAQVCCRNETQGRNLRYVFPFVVHRDGRHLVEIDLSVPSRRDQGQRKTLPLTNLSVHKCEERSALIIHREAWPGQSFFLHLWGWQPTRYLTRHGKISAAYFRLRIVEETAKWGGNYMMLYPWAKPDYFNDGDMFDALEYAHAWGFLVDQHSGAHGPDLNEKNEAFERHFSTFFERNSLHPDRTLDGWETEQHGKADQNTLGSFESVININHITWKYHPGSFISECKYPAAGNDSYELNLNQGFHGPNYAKVLMCAGRFRNRLNGYDDVYFISPLPDEAAFRNSYNWVFRGYQADSRMYSPNKLGGCSSIDWIAKEAWDFARLHARASQDKRPPLSSALHWLGESNLALPEDMREAVNAISMDPCRAALVYRLVSTGHDGLLFWKLNARGIPLWYEHSFRHREWLPGSTVRIHNGMLAVNCSAFSADRKMVWDIEGLGQFDLNAPSVSLVKSLFTTRLEKAPDKPKTYCFASTQEECERCRVSLPAGTYEILVSYLDASSSFLAEMYLMSQYIGTLSSSAPPGESTFHCFISDANEHTFEIQRVKGDHLPPLTIRFVPTPYVVELLGRINASVDSASVSTDRGTDLAPTSSPMRLSFTLPNDTGATPPIRLADSESSSRVLDLWFAGEAGTYLLTFRVRCNKSNQKLSVTLNSHWYNKEDYESDQNTEPADIGIVTENWALGNNWKGVPGRYGRIAEVEMEQEWETHQVPVVCPHRSGKRMHKVELSVGKGAGVLEFDSIALFNAPMSQRILSHGGHRAVYEESCRMKEGETVLAEICELTCVADEPTIQLRAIQEVTGTNIPAVSEIDCSDYEEALFDGIQQELTTIVTKVPDRILLRDPSGLRPDLTIVFLQKNDITGIEWHDGKIRLRRTLNGRTVTSFTVTTRNASSVGLRKYLGSEPEEIALTEAPYKLKNEESFPKVFLVKVTNPIRGPYFVQEEGWWSVRGAQPLHHSEAAWQKYLDDYYDWILTAEPSKMPRPPYTSDLVRLLMPSRGHAAIQRYGFIKNIARPGWGCQKQLLLRDLTRTGCRVKVLSVSAYLFAPRVEFRLALGQVMLNGQPWAYRDTHHVFLPQKPGEHEIEISDKDQAEHPTLTSTCASVRSAVYSGNTLCVVTELPDYVFDIPPSLNYALGISFASSDYEVRKVEGGRLISTGKYGAVVQQDRLGRTVIEFRKLNRVKG